MKKVVFNLFAISLITLFACNSGNSKINEPTDTTLKKATSNTTTRTASTPDENVKIVTITYTNVDPKATASIKEIVGHYIQIKNSLANDNSRGAADAGKEMEAAIGKFDTSVLTSEQKKTYDDIEDEMKEDAEHMGKNAGNIKHQREHFSMMSESVYDLVKAFGAGKALYQDHCPMYNKGASWISEIKEIKNPYFGGEMSTCGSVAAMIK